MLTASRGLGLLDELRVPYARRPDGGDGWHRVEGDRPERAMHFYAGEAAGPPAEHRVWDIPIWARVAPDEEVSALARGLAGDWRRDAPVRDGGGAVRSWTWRSDAGGTILPFDPDEVVANYRSERYLRLGARPTAALETAMRRTYYRLRPLMPRRLQLAARRSFSRVQRHGTFPRWPVEPALHDLTDLLLARVADAAGGPVPSIAPWPVGHSWALVLTHDVETAAGRDAIERVRTVEAALGLRSSWNLVPERYAVADELVARLRRAGCEIGLHGLRHDGRDLASRRALARRLPEMRRWAERWGAVGFRAPALHRVWDWMPGLGFDYDSSYPDTDPYEPIAGGCCTWLPFFNGAMVELPVTLAQDHTLFEILRIGDVVWHEKAALLRRRGGMALIDTHPDYMLANAPLRAYERLLRAFGNDPRAWTALPVEVSDWWRRRAATSLELVDGSWRARGPGAAAAAIRFLETNRR